MPVFIDQLQRKILIDSTPKRIISLVPSQTELLADLGLNEEIVGITKFCVHPQEWFKKKTRIGGTKKLHLEKIRALQPDLILANKEENEKEQLEILMKEFPVWISDIFTLEDALAMIQSVGRITGKEEKALSLIANIEKQFIKLKACLRQGFGRHGPKLKAGFHSKLKAAYFIWKDPWMVAGSHTFIDDMLQKCGLQNAFGHLSRYPVIEPEQLKECDLILLSSEPFPFKQKHAEMLRKFFPKGEILFVDGEMFSWYGSRLLQAPVYFQSLFTQ